MTMNDESWEEVVKTIEYYFKVFFDKMKMKLTEKNSCFILYNNGIFGLKFSYGNRYLPTMLEGVQLVILNSPYHSCQDEKSSYKRQYYDFFHIINFMQKRWQRETIADSYTCDYSVYASYLESHMIPFLAIEDGETKLKEYVSELYISNTGHGSHQQE